MFLFHAQLDEFSIGYYTRKWKRPIRSILRARWNDKESLAHDPMDCEPCDMDQVEFSATVFLTKDRKKPAKRLQWSASREREEKRREEENGPRMHRMVPKHSSSVVGNRSILTGWKRGKQERFLLHHDSMIRLLSKIYTRVFGFIEKLPSFEREIVIGLNLDGKDTKRHDEFHTFN